MKNLKKYSAFAAAMCMLLSILLLACACATDSDADIATTEKATVAATAAKTTAATTDEPIITRPAATTEPAPVKVTYTVKVVGTDGEVIPGVEIQMCDALGCRLPKVTDANGTVVAQENESEYQVQINAVPAGYVKPDAKIDFPAGETTLTITLAKAN